MKLLLLLLLATAGVRLAKTSPSRYPVVDNRDILTSINGPSPEDVRASAPYISVDHKLAPEQSSLAQVGESEEKYRPFHPSQRNCPLLGKIWEDGGIAKAYRWPWSINCFLLTVDGNSNFRKVFPKFLPWNRKNFWYPISMTRGDVRDRWYQPPYDSEPVFFPGGLDVYENRQLVEEQFGQSVAAVQVGASEDNDYGYPTAFGIPGSHKLTKKQFNKIANLIAKKVTAQEIAYFIRQLLGIRSQGSAITLVSRLPVGFGILGNHNLTTEQFNEIAKKIKQGVSKEELKRFVEELLGRGSLGFGTRLITSLIEGFGIAGNHELTEEEFFQISTKILRQLLGIRSQGSAITLVSRLPVGFGILGNHNLTTEQFNEIAKKIKQGVSKEELKRFVEELLGRGSLGFGTRLVTSLEESFDIPGNHELIEEEFAKIQQGATRLLDRHYGTEYDFLFDAPLSMLDAKVSSPLRVAESHDNPPVLASLTEEETTVDNIMDKTEDFFTNMFETGDTSGAATVLDSSPSLDSARAVGRISNTSKRTSLNSGVPLVPEGVAPVIPNVN